MAFTYVFAVYSWIEAAGFRSAYPTAGDRLAFARVFAGNDAIRLFYGYPFDVATVGGYTAWRVGGTLALAGAAFGVFAAVRALRGEEEAGRSEMVLSGIVSRRAAFGSSVLAVAAGTATLWAAELVGFLVAGLPPGGSAYLAMADASVVWVFVGVGALTSQLATSRRLALGLGVGSAAVSWLLRVLADILHSMGWIRWATPLGWSEELRPFAGARPVVLLLPLLATGALLLTAARISMKRDLGSGLLPHRSTGRSWGVLLSSPAALTVRRQRGILAIWVVGYAAFAAVLGAISTSISGAGLSKTLERDFAKLGAGSIVTPAGYLSFVSIVFIFATCLFVVSQMGAARQEEADQQLETLLAQPLDRGRWFVGRLVIAVVAACVLSATAGLLMWAGAASQGLHVSLGELMEAGANGVPVSLTMLGLSALAYAVLPRASTAVSYSLVTVAFLWYLVGSVFGLPKWVVGLTPFQHIGLVPAQSFRVVAAVVMVVVGVVAVALALAVFRRRDLLGE